MSLTPKNRNIGLKNPAKVKHRNEYRKYLMERFFDFFQFFYIRIKYQREKLKKQENRGKKTGKTGKNLFVCL